ncbi:hypothetical protein [Ureibacillus endophyticus]|uniref:Uncharacterized protein n=1 Tax=Ureibacillus endophyticus TaxID=1978490 RepID=A0A494Z218_9BACL|nr:hypothetical protein [Lysinibacillus endophyticus]RKQ16445.1 hypothetical protein D8M03_09660 [Lysinibacillus endophyticus]
MDREQFYNTHPDERVDIINKMLKNSSLKEIAKKIGVPESSFSKEMTNGDYVYIKRDNQYYKYIRDKNMISNNHQQSQDVISFIEQNMEVLKAILRHHEDSRNMLILDEQVYSKKAKYMNKSIKMNSEIYDKFVKFCEEKYPFLTLQDLVAQALLDFINRYK